MKKLVALFLALALLCSCGMALADEAQVPEGYPEVIKDDSGNPINLGGMEIYIYDYWTSSAERSKEPDEKTAATYAYQDWLMETYNFKMTQIAKGDWASNVEEMISFAQAPDTNALFILAPGFVSGPLANDMLTPWDPEMVSKSKFNSATVDFMTKGGKIYGVSVGKAEPRQCLYFNKRVLKEAGINVESIYDMQKDGTWTWDEFEKLLKQLTRDTDNDGVNDVFGMTGFNSDMWLISVFSNGGSFFDYDANGELVVTANSDATKNALTWAKYIWDTYTMPAPDGSSWDYFKEAFKQGNCGFYMYQCYGGFNMNGEQNTELIDMEDEWGCVAFPKGPNGSDYMTVVSENVTVLPNCYEEDVAKKIMFAYDLWTDEIPGYSTEDTWADNLYQYPSDDRAVDETYALLREPEHQVVNKSVYLGDDNTVFGETLFWQLGSSDPSTLIDAAMNAWQGRCDIFNKKTPAATEAPAEDAPAAEEAAEVPAEDAPAAEATEAPAEAEATEAPAAE